MATSPTQKLETAPEPPHRSKYSKVTSEYRKAHKNYVLVAGLLASWELIGIELNTQEKWGIKLLSPRAVPLILFTLLVYSAYKVIIEWNQEEDPRPKSRKARIDFWVAHVIGVSAVLIGVIQAMLKIRLADTAATHLSGIRDMGGLIVLAGVIYGFMANRRQSQKTFKYHVLAVAILFLVGITCIYVSDTAKSAILITIFFTIAILIGRIANNALDKRLKQR